RLAQDASFAFIIPHTLVVGAGKLKGAVDQCGECQLTVSQIWQLDTTSRIRFPDAIEVDGRRPRPYFLPVLLAVLIEVDPPQTGPFRTLKNAPYWFHFSSCHCLTPVWCLLGRTTIIIHPP